MELPEIAKRIFGKDYFDGSTSRIVCKTSKKIFLIEAKEWMQEFLTDISTSSFYSASENEDNRLGRIGGNNVYFTLDRSFGIVAINQEGLNVVAACRFASVSASCGIYEGKWMYELHLGSKGIMQIGWCSNLCAFTIDRGCGDTQNSYAYDGSRIRTWNMLSREYGELWKTGDVIGICIDLEEATIEFFRNGHSMGIAFRNIAVGSGIIYIPCVSLVEGESVYANFGARPFRYPVAKYLPLQQKPYMKIKQTEYVLKWLDNLTNLIVPDEPEVLNCNLTGDISDRLFWNRFYSSMCYHLNALLVNRYCLFNNFVPFILEVSGLKYEKGKVNLDKFHRIMDEMWLYMKEKNMERSLCQIMNYSTNSFKQVSETLYCATKNHILNILFALMSHKTTRKYIIKNLMFERMDLFAFMHHKPLDEQYFNELIGNSWWDTKGQISEIERNKKSFKNAFNKIEKSYNEIEIRQCMILKLIFNNSDGDEYEPCSRFMFLRKWRKYCWHELECHRNDLSSKLPTSIAYATFLRFTRTLYELWDEEIGDTKLHIPPNYFYDHTFKYTNCDRIGGLEQFLLHTYHDDLVTVLGEDHNIFTAETSRNPSLPIQELRTIGLSEAVDILESNESVIENFIMPTTSSGPFYQSLFAPFFRQQSEDQVVGNLDSKNSLLELYEDLLMFFMSAVAKHCKKISKVQFNLEQCATEYNDMYVNTKKMKNMKSKNELVFAVMENTMNLQKEDLGKRAKKNAWVEHVLLNPVRFQYFILIFEILVNIVVESEKQGDLFVFLPDFYLDACDIFTDVLLKDFNFVASSRPPEFMPTVIKLVELMITLIGDKRIKHIDCKKTPINILASFTTCKDGMRILESIHPNKAMELIEKLAMPYNDRHWKASNWILVRFWHGSGFGFRYTNLPHHNPSSTQSYNQLNYIMYNIVSCPSALYQKLVRERLLDTNAQIPVLLDSIISELHWTFGEFLTPMQELQRAIERNEQLLMMGRLYKMCSNYFDKTIGLLRVLDMFISLAPEVFLESYYPESTAFTRRIIQIVLLIIHRISSKQGCFRTVMNSRIAVLENVEYFPIESACIGILVGILHHEFVRYTEEDITIPLFCRMVLTDPSYDLENLTNLIGSPDTRNNVLVSLHDYEHEVMLEKELQEARNMLKMLDMFAPKLSSAKVIPEDELCTICYSAPFDVKFDPCGHNSCLSCISYYITRNRLCFFCKRPIQKVIKISNNEVIESLTDRELELEAS